jgi:hypothetical protein
LHTHLWHAERLLVAPQLLNRAPHALVGVPEAPHACGEEGPLAAGLARLLKRVRVRVLRAGGVGDSERKERACKEGPARSATGSRVVAACVLAWWVRA